MFVDNIVVGSCYESYLYSFLNGYHHLFNAGTPAFFYDSLKVGFFGEKNKKSAVTQIKLYLALSGRHHDFPNLERIKIEDSCLKVYSSYPTATYCFNVCHVFGQENISVENEILFMRPLSYKVVDDFEVKNLPKSVKNVEPMFSRKGGFINKIYFYTSERILGAQHITDCVSESLLTSEQLNSLEYSDTVAKFLIQRKLIKAGIKGRVVGQTKAGKSKYSPPEVTHINRFVYEVSEAEYKNTKNVIFKKLSEGDILSNYAEGD